MSSQSNASFTWKDMVHAVSLGLYLGMEAGLTLHLHASWQHRFAATAGLAFVWCSIAELIFWKMPFRLWIIQAPLAAMLVGAALCSPWWVNLLR